MAFDYDKLKAKQVEGESSWTSNSDLFMVLSLVFLLLYVVSSLRNGSSSVQKSIQYQELKKRNADLEQQILAYEALKDDYLQKEASKSEVSMYGELMDKLTLLKEEAKEEKNDLRKKALENEKKENALNKYQQLVRNIVNTNLLAQQRINKRDRKIKVRDKDIEKKENIISKNKKVIAKNKRVIAGQRADLKAKRSVIRQKKKIIARKQRELKATKREITKLHGTIKNKKKEIRKNNSKISRINRKLDKQIKELNYRAKKYKTSKKQLNRKIKDLKKVSAKKVRKLNKLNAKTKKNLSNVNQSLASIENQLKSASRVIKKQKSEQIMLNRELKKSSVELVKNKEIFQKRVYKLKAQHEAKLKVEKKEKGRQLASIKKLSKSLKKAKTLMNTRRRLAKKMARNFKKKGIDAKVNLKTGDVTISFGRSYFDRGKANLKNKMRKHIRKFIPEYSETLFSDPEISKKIAAVEIIGFASPTYRGKFVNPESLDPRDQKAVNYNLSLSQDRANSVFRYIFNKNKLKYKYQKNLFPLVKVTGRSFMSSEIKNTKQFEGLSQKEFCKRYDCNKAQRVIVKFSLKN